MKCDVEYISGDQQTEKCQPRYTSTTLHVAGWDRVLIQDVENYI